MKDDVTHIISHTHWDREWYLPFENFRFRLVKMVDRCIEVLTKEPRFKFFNFDGQTILLEDYLEVKPENEGILKELIQKGKIGIGPWYLLNSPYLQTGEGTIRNLLFGRRLCKRFGVDPLNLGYVPDQFILPPQMPQIMKGFGITNMAFCRGLNDQYEKYGIKSEFFWAAPDGSKVTMIHMMKGYGMAGFLPNNVDIALNQLLAARGTVEPIPRITNQVLMFNGSDHTDPDEILPELIEIWNDEEDIVEEFGTAKHSSWDEFFHDFWAQNPELKEISGELSGHKYQFASKGVFSNRMPIKQENFKMHHLLEKYSEPFQIISYSLNDGEVDDLNNFIRLAWKYLLQNQPHDSSWASSPDPIIEDMWARFRWANQVADEVFRRSAHLIISRIKFEKAKKGVYRIVVFNPTPYYRNDVVKCAFPISSADKDKTLVLLDSYGSELPAKFSLRESKGDDRYVLRTFVPSHGPLPRYLMEVTFFGRGIPPMGFETFRILAPEKVAEFKKDADDEVEEVFVNADNNFLENDVLKVIVEKNGTLTIYDKETKKYHRNFNLFEDTGNRGCNYEYIPLEDDQPITTKDCIAESKLVGATPAFSELLVEIPWKLPESISEDKKKRSEKMVDFNIKSYVRIYPGTNRRIDIRTEFINTAKWHQLRVLFPTDLKTDKEFVKTHFHIYHRPVETPWDFEPPRATTGAYPQHEFMGIYDDSQKYGVSILNKGLPAYETFLNGDNKEITIALILLRSHAQWIAHLDLKPNIETPDAQFYQKKICCEYSIVPMNDNYVNMNITKIANEYIAPLRAEMVWDVFRLERYKPKKSLPQLFSVLELLEGNIELSAYKMSEDKKGTIIRFYDFSGIEHYAMFRIAGSIKELKWVDLKEDPLNQEDTPEYTLTKDEDEKSKWIRDL
ncbi:MAG: glycoside hydrolase family 38 C-terminal domain-containing protein, partial [Promethearchaeota archaeon]